MAPLKLKVWLAGEVENLCVAQSDVDSLRDEMSSLNRALEGSKAAEQLALDRAKKANEIVDLFHKEVEAERQSSATLGAQVALLTKRLEDTSAVGLAVA